MEQAKIPWERVDSSNVEAVAYDRNSETLCVRFLSGGLYSYHDLSEELYLNLLNAPSVGKYLNLIKGLCPFQKWESEEQLFNSFAERNK